MAHAISLFIGLGLLWILLSGFFDPLLLSFGLLSCVLVVIIVRRLDTLDRESVPTYIFRKAALYWPWLAWQIVLANIDVAKRILKPGMPIAPEMIRVKASQITDLGKVFYANSITLTPGTVTVDMAGDELLIHAIGRGPAKDLEDGEMDRRVTATEGQV